MSRVDDTIKIGSNVRGGASGGGPREKVIRTEAERSKALREGNLSTARKYGGVNAPGDGTGGQRMTKIANSDDIIKPPTVGKEVGQAISDQRQKMVPKMSQKDLAVKCHMSVADLSAFERGTAAPDQSQLTKLEKHLGIKLRGTGIGGPLKPPKSKENPPKKK